MTRASAGSARWRHRRPPSGHKELKLYSFVRFTRELFRTIIPRFSVQVVVVVVVA